MIGGSPTQKPKEEVVFMKKWFIVLVLVASVLFIYGKSLPVVTLFCRAGPEGAAHRAQVEYWNTHLARKYGFKVKIIEASRADYYTYVNNTLLAGGKTPDILESYSGFLALYAKSKIAYDLTDWYMDDKLFPYDRSDWIDIAMKLVTYKGRIYALPTDTNTYLLFYRKDLIPNPPKTWDELYEVAKKFTKKYNKNSPTMYGIAFYGRKSESLPMFWYQIFRSYGGTWWYDKPAFDSEPAMKAINWVVKVIKEGLVPPDISTYEYMEILGALQTGQIALAVQWDAAYPTLRDKKSSPLVWNKIGVAMIPGVKTPEGIRRAHSAHDQMLVINPRSEHKKEAFIFMAWATASPIGAKIYAMNGGSPPRKSILSDPEVLEKFPRFKVKLPGLNMWGYAEPQLPDYPEMKDILNTYLAKVWALEMDPEEALKRANQEIYEFLKSKGYY